jgi:hypothetical protein
MDWVFAYGSNMNLPDLRSWLGKYGYEPEGILEVVRAELPGYQLVWNYHSNSRRGGAANVKIAPNETLPGVALGVTADVLEALDQKEGNPKYYSRGTDRIRITLEGGRTVSAWLYVAVPERCSAVPVWPRKDYLQLLLDAAHEHGLPASHIDSLAETPTVN